VQPASIFALAGSRSVGGLSNGAAGDSPLPDMAQRNRRVLESNLTNLRALAHGFVRR